MRGFLRQMLCVAGVAAVSVGAPTPAAASDDYLAEYASSKWHGGSVDNDGDRVADFCIMIPKRPKKQVLLLFDTVDGLVLGLINPLWHMDDVGGLIDVDLIVPGHWNSGFTAKITDTDTIAVTVGPLFEVIEAIKAGNELFAHHYIGDFEMSLSGTRDAMNVLQRCFRDQVEPHLTNAVTPVPSALSAATYQEGREAFKNKDYRNALAIWQQVAMQGNAKAMNGIGQIHHRGLDVPKDYQAALYWYEQAAELGLDDAQYNLARLYDKGLGTDVDYDQAVAWYRKSAAQGYARAQLLLGVKYQKGQGVPEDPEAARHWYLLAAQNGNRTAQFNLGSLLRTGRGGATDPEQAVYWYRRSAEQGHVLAQVKLGDALSQGIGAQKDAAEAYKWYLLASDNGKEGAAEKLLDLQDQISSAERKTATQLATKWSAEREPSGNARVPHPTSAPVATAATETAPEIVTKPLPDDLFGVSETKPAPAAPLPTPSAAPVAPTEVRVEGCYDLSKAAAICKAACTDPAFAGELAGSQFVRKNGPQAPVQYCLNGCKQAEAEFAQALTIVSDLKGSKFFCPMLFERTAKLALDNNIPCEHGDKSARKSHAKGSNTYNEATRLEATPEQLATLSRAPYSPPVQALVDQIPPTLEGCYDTTGTAAMDHCRAECIEDAKFPGTGLTGAQALALCNSGCDWAAVHFKDQAIWLQAKNEDGLSGTFCSAVQFTDIAREEVRNQALMDGQTKYEASEIVGGVISYWKGALIAGGR